MTVIQRECCTDLPPLPPQRRRLGRHTFDHDNRRRRLGRECIEHDPRRVWGRYFGPTDPGRISNVVEPAGFFCFV